MLLLEDITAGYGAGAVLRDVTVRVPSGSVVALIGPNGAGKTTLLRVASGLLRPQSGRVLLDGTDLTSAPDHARVDVGLSHIPEGRGIFRNLSVRENLVLFSSRGGETEAIDRAVSAFPRLGERLGQVAGTMSGGEQQMLALARAYVRRPSVVLLDEVSMGLAPALVNEIYDFVLRLAAEEGVALLLVEQFIPKALSVADYVFILNGGEISFAGEPSELESETILAHYLGADDGVPVAH